MKKKAETIVMEFFQDRFGKLMAGSIFKQYLKKFKISDFEKLGVNDQIKIGEKIIEGIFNKFFTPERVQNMKILYMLRFSLNEAGDKVDNMMNVESELHVEPLVNIDLSEVDDILKEIDSEDKVQFGFECSQLIDGLLMITMDKSTTNDFADLVTTSMMGTKSESRELDEMKISAVYEFFNILLPEFIRVIGDLLNAEVFYTPLYYDDFKKKYFQDDKFMEPQKILKSSLSITLQHKTKKCNVVFFIKESKASFESLVEQGESREKDPFEQMPPKILVDKTPDIRADVEKLFKILHLSAKDVDLILQQIEKSTVHDLDYHDVVNFSQKLILFFFPKASENKKESIKVNLLHVFGMAR
ncbi:MAG: hypothetical protein ACLFPQ_00120 [Candidatus Woesearchaeota archaeon]